MKVSELYVGQLAIVEYLGEGKGSRCGWQSLEGDPYVIVERKSDRLLEDVIRGDEYYDWKKVNRNDGVLKRIDGQMVIVQTQPLMLYWRDSECIDSDELKKFLSEINELGNQMGETAKRTR